MFLLDMYTLLRAFPYLSWLNIRFLIVSYLRAFPNSKKR
jgi:hypothetical protein